MTGRLPRCSHHESPSESGGPGSGAHAAAAAAKCAIAYEDRLVVTDAWPQRSRFTSQLLLGPLCRPAGEAAGVPEVRFARSGLRWPDRAPSVRARFRRTGRDHGQVRWGEAGRVRRPGRRRKVRSCGCGSGSGAGLALLHGHKPRPGRRMPRPVLWCRCRARRRQAIYQWLPPFAPVGAGAAVGAMAGGGLVIIVAGDVVGIGDCICIAMRWCLRAMSRPWVFPAGSV
jgi:hypothetical protein